MRSRLALVTIVVAATTADARPEVRLTGEQLAERGATDLASALALLPDVLVRSNGRGGFEVEIRGAVEGAVAVRIDGVMMRDPFDGAFDVSTMPITDVVEIRVTTTMSPLDGLGGPGGSIDVVTRAAVGPQLVLVRGMTDTSPGFGMTGGGRAALTPKVAVRVSASGSSGARDLALPTGGTIGEARRAAAGAARLELRDRTRQVALDGFVSDRRFIVQPREAIGSSILQIDRETQVRGAASAEDRLGKMTLRGHYYAEYLHRRSRAFADPTFADQIAKENLFALRSGVLLVATRPFHRGYSWIASVAIDREKALVFDRDERYVKGDATLFEQAFGVTYTGERLRINADIGTAMPFGVGNEPWPEGRIEARLAARPTTELVATGALKGRLPTLRERLEDVIGNPTLDAELSVVGELRAIERRGDLRLELATFLRETSGLIMPSPLEEAMGRLINLDHATFYGVDARAIGRVNERIELGAAYQLVRSTRDDVERWPRHHLDTWTRLTATSRVSGVVRASYVGASREAGTRIEDYVLLEASVAARFAADYLAVLRIDDALDAAPMHRLGERLPGRVLSLSVQAAWH